MATPGDLSRLRRRHAAGPITRKRPAHSNRSAETHRRADEPRVPRTQRQCVDAQPPRRRRTEAVDEDVALRGQRIENAGRVRRSQIQRHAALVAVDALKKRAAGRPAHRVPAAWIFDLDHVRAEIGEHERRVRARQQARQVEDADSLKRRHGGVGCA